MSERYTERVQQERVEDWERIKDVMSEDMVFIDEAASNRGMTRLQGRERKESLRYSSKKSRKKRDNDRSNSPEGDNSICQYI